MKTDSAIEALSALAQVTRMGVFRLLVRNVPAGLPAGELARLAAVPQNTMSTHLAILLRAGLIRAERRGRSIIYHADLTQVQALTLFLLRDCCGGSPDLCAPVVAALSLCEPA